MHDGANYQVYGTQILQIISGMGVNPFELLSGFSFHTNSLVYFHFIPELVLTGNSRKKQDEAHEPECYTYVNGTDVKTHGYAVTHNIFLQ